MRRGGLLLLGLCLAAPAAAKPVAPKAFCDALPEAPACAGGVPACTLCHAVPPARNAFGAQLADVLAPEAPRPLSDDDFTAGLADALAAVGALDADGDDADNAAELAAGTLPADADSVPRAGPCTPSMMGAWNLCGYDPAFAFKRVWLDVCGHSPTFADLEAFVALEPDAQMARLHDTLDACLDTPFWQGQDGVVWRLAHTKVRPIRAVKSGENAGPIPLGDYDDDYRLFVWTQTDDRDAREVLTADYFVAPAGFGRLEKVATRTNQPVTGERRAGMLTHRWFLVLNVMFTGIPRTAAAHAYRAFLGLDVARMEGLVPVEGEPADYDDKGVTEPACAACHSTLDPLTYPFSRYHGITGRALGYDPQRVARYYRNEAPTMAQTPEAGVFMGQPVADLVEWAEAAANSDDFARNTARDYWRLLVGHDPTPGEAAEFNALWKAFKGEHGYRVEAMLHALIETEAYGAP